MKRNYGRNIMNLSDKLQWIPLMDHERWACLFCDGWKLGIIGGDQLCFYVCISCTELMKETLGINENETNTVV